jgi:hypothetical protein
MLSSVRECCAAKCHLQANNLSATSCTAAMRLLVALSAFLDVSSLNLAVPQGAAIFLLPDLVRDMGSRCPKLMTHPRSRCLWQRERVEQQPPPFGRRGCCWTERARAGHLIAHSRSLQAAPHRETGH